MANEATKQEIYCECIWKHYDCFAYDDDKNGNCDALSNCEFPGRTDCPFYKPESAVPDSHLKELKEAKEAAKNAEKKQKKSAK